MNSEVPKWMGPEPVICFRNRSEEASENKPEEEEEEMERFKRPRTTLDSEGGVEEFLALLERIEETKKLSKRKSINFSVSSINAIELDQMFVAPTLMQQPQDSSEAVATIVDNKRTTSPWKPSFQWEDFNITNSVSAQTDLGGAAAAKKNKDGEGSIRKSFDFLKTRRFLDGVTPAECSHDHADYVNNKKEEDDVDAATKIELQLFW